MPTTLISLLCAVLILMPSVGRAQTHTSLAERIRTVGFVCPTSEPHCRENIALILVNIFSVPTVACMGVLTAGGKVLTNSHCVNVAEGRNCSDDIAVLFPVAQGAPRRAARCTRVSRKSEIHTTSAIVQWDVAEIEVEPVGAATLPAPATLSSEGLPNGLNVSVVHSTEPVGLSNDYTYSQQACSTVMRTLTLPSYSSAAAPVGLLSDCPLEVGDSGGPVYDAAGAVRALSYATDSFSGIRAGDGFEGRNLPPHLHASLSSDSAAPRPVAWVANLQCLARGTPCSYSPDLLQQRDDSEFTGLIQRIESRLTTQNQLLIDSARRPSLRTILRP